MTEKHTFLSPKGPNYLCLTCGNPDEHEIHGKTYAKRPVEGATGAREWPYEAVETVIGDWYVCLNDPIDQPGPIAKNLTRENAELIRDALNASSQLKKLDGVAQQAGDEIVQTLMPSMDSEMFIRHTKKVTSIISKLIAERLSK